MELERAVIAAADAAETPIAATVMADNNIGPTVGRAWLLRFMSMEFWFGPFQVILRADARGEAAHKEAE